MITLPEKPWEKGDDFTVEETGVRYVYDGEKWLSESGEAADLSGFATKAFVDEIESASVFRDETIKTDLEDKDKKQTAAILKVESDVIYEEQWRKEADEKLQEQIDAIEIPSTEPDVGTKAGSLNWVDYTFSGDTIDALSKQARIHPDRTKMSLNKDLVEGGNRNWTNLFEPYPSVIGMELDGTIHRVVVESTGQAGQNGRGHNFKILEHDLPMEDQTDAVVGIYPDYVDATIDLSTYITKEESKADDRQLQAEIDQLALGLETLLQQREAGKWTYKGALADGTPSRAGEFSLASDDLSSTDNIIILNQTDLDDKLHGFGDVEVGDYVEIVDLDKPDEYALFVVDSEPDGTGIVSINLRLKDKGNNFLVGTTCEIRFFAINEQNLDLTELDQRYLKLTGGRLSGNLRFTGEKPHIGYIDDNNQNWIQFQFGSTTEYKGFYSTDNAIATKKRVDEAVEGLASEEWVAKEIGKINIPEGGKPVLSVSWRGNAEPSSNGYPTSMNGFAPMNENGQVTSDSAQVRMIRWSPKAGHWAKNCEGLGKRMGTLTFTKASGGDHWATYQVENVENEGNYLLIRVTPDYAVNSFGNNWPFVCQLDSALRET